MGCRLIKIFPFVLFISCFGPGGLDDDALNGSQITVKKVADVSGVVVDGESGLPVFGATVKIATTSSMTGEDGQFYVSEVKVGEQMITVQHRAYQAYSDSVIVRTGSNALGQLEIFALGVDAGVDPDAAHTGDGSFMSDSSHLLDSWTPDTANGDSTEADAGMVADDAATADRTVGWDAAVHFDATSVDRVSDDRMLRDDAAGAWDATSSDMPPADHRAWEDASSGFVDASSPDECGNGSLMCMGSCRPCPTEDVNGYFACDSVSSECVVRCDLPYLACGQSCVLCDSNTVSAVCSQQDECVPLECTMGYRLQDLQCTPWRISEIHSQPGVSAIAIGPSDDRRFVAFQDDSNLGLGLAQIAADTQVVTTEVIDTDAKIDFELAIAVGGDDQPHVMYLHRQDKSVNYASKPADQWQIQVMEQTDISYLGHIALTLDGNNRPLMTYPTEDQGSFGLTLAKHNGTQFEYVQYSEFPLIRPARSSLVYNDLADAAVLFYPQTGVNEVQLRSHRWSSVTSEHTGIVAAAPNEKMGQFSSAQVRTGGGYGVAYWNETENAMYYATGHEDSWTLEQVATGLAASGYPCPDLVLDNQDNPHVLYCDDEALVFASRTVFGDTVYWRRSVIGYNYCNTYLGYGSGLSISLAIDSRDKISISASDDVVVYLIQE